MEIKVMGISLFNDEKDATAVQTIRETMRFFTVSNEHVEASGSCLRGYLDIKYSDLVSAFGEPLSEGRGKVDWEWIIKFSDGCVATVYNWKNGPGYGFNIDPEDILKWNVGGFSKYALENIKAALLIDGKLS